MATIRYHCTQCHHEWDSAAEDEHIPQTSNCDWCMAPGYEIARYASMDYNKMLEMLKDLQDKTKSEEE